MSSSSPLSPPLRLLAITVSTRTARSPDIVDGKGLPDLLLRSRKNGVDRHHGSLLMKCNLLTRETASTRHNLIRDHIEASWTLIDHFLTGSYDRDTKTKKLKDVDIFVVIDPQGDQGTLANGTGTAAIGALRNVLATRWDDVEVDDQVVTRSTG